MLYCVKKNMNNFLVGVIIMPISIFFHLIYPVYM